MVWVTTMDQRAHSNRKLRFQGFCRSIHLIERVFWPFYSTVRLDMQYRLAFLWPYNLLSDKVLRITVYSCANAPAGPSWTIRCLAIPRLLGLSFAGPLDPVTLRYTRIAWTIRTMIPLGNQHEI